MNRDEARAAGLTRFDGQLCKIHRHERGKRYVANGACIACIRENTAKARLDPKYVAGVKARARKRRATRKAERESEL